MAHNAGKRDDAFNLAVERVLKHEGGYVNNPRDPGGETNYGITKATARAAGYKGSMRDLPRDRAKKIYKSAYWDRIWADQMPAEVAFQVFDAAVNHGPKQAVKMAQQACGITGKWLDGLIGPKTIDAINRADPVHFTLNFNAVRIGFYTGLSTFGTFGRGWMNRVARNLEYAAVDLE